MTDAPKRKPLKLRKIAHAVESLTRAHLQSRVHQAAIIEHLQHLLDAHNAPKRIIRDPETGRPIGAEINGQHFALVRDHAGRISHMQPLTGSQ